MSRTSSALSAGGTGSSKRNTTFTFPSAIAGGDYLDKEDEYDKLNAELEARTAMLLKDAESAMKHNESLLADDLASVSREYSRKPITVNHFSSGDVRSEETTNESSFDNYYDDEADADEDYGVSLEEQLRANRKTVMSLYDAKPSSNVELSNRSKSALESNDRVRSKRLSRQSSSFRSKFREKLSSLVFLAAFNIIEKHESIFKRCCSKIFSWKSC